MYNNRYARQPEPPTPQYYNPPDARSNRDAYQYPQPAHPVPNDLSYNPPYTTTYVPGYARQAYQEPQWQQGNFQQPYFDQRGHDYRRDHSWDQGRSSLYMSPSAPPFHPTHPVHSQSQRDPPPPRPRTPPRPSYPNQPYYNPRPTYPTPRSRTPPLARLRTPPPPQHASLRDEVPLPDGARTPTDNRRKKIARSGPGVSLTPTDAYLAATELPVLSIVPSLHNPMLLVLDLNNCILFRKERSSKGSKIPIPRPYLASFLEYVCGFERISWVEGEGGEVGRRFATVVYSSARSYNVLSMIAALSLVPAPRAALQERGKPWTARPGDALEMVFTREMMGLSPAEFEQNVETVKDLAELWKGLGQRWSAERTVLLDDESFKASLQPYNHLPIEPFVVRPEHLPTSPPSSPRAAAAESGISTPSMFFYPNLPEDTALLSTTYLLSVLRTKSNVASFIRAGGLAPLRSLGEEELAKRGVAVLESAGIELRREWDPAWWTKCLAVKGIVG